MGRAGGAASERRSEENAGPATKHVVRSVDFILSAMEGHKGI